MKKIFKILGITLLVFTIYFGYNNYPLDLLSGFSAKSVASGHFIANRSQEMIENGDNDFFPIYFATNKIDKNFIKRSEMIRKNQNKRCDRRVAAANRVWHGGSEEANL